MGRLAVSELSGVAMNMPVTHRIWTAVSAHLVKETDHESQSHNSESRKTDIHSTTLKVIKLKAKSELIFQQQSRK